MDGMLVFLTDGFEARIRNSDIHFRPDFLRFFNGRRHHGPDLVQLNVMYTAPRLIKVQKV